MEAPRRRLQVSLASLILLSLLTGALVMMFLSHRRAQSLKAEVENLQSENTKLRDELGILTVSDPTKICVIALRPRDRSFYDFIWRWKIHLPNGKYNLHYAIDRIPQTGYPEKDWGFEIGRDDNQEICIDASIRKNSGGAWILHIGSPDEPQYKQEVGLKTEDAERLTVGGNMPQAGLDHTEVFDPDGKVELLRYRAGQRKPGVFVPIEDPDPCPGLLIWIEKVEIRQIPNP